MPFIGLLPCFVNKYLILFSISNWVSKFDTLVQYTVPCGFVNQHFYINPVSMLWWQLCMRKNSSSFGGCYLLPILYCMTKSGLLKPLLQATKWPKDLLFYRACTSYAKWQKTPLPRCLDTTQEIDSPYGFRDINLKWPNPFDPSCRPKCESPPNLI